MPRTQISPRRVAVLASDRDVHDLIRRRSLALHARMGVAEAIRALALDLCGGADGLSQADQALLRQHIAAPVNEATEEALRVLVDELTTALRTVPPRLRPSFVAPLVSRTDFE
jgi:hypothetical protein